ncbi:MAG: di-heme oxidoredictase family protein, partial [Pseudomonadota bacterium]
MRVGTSVLLIMLATVAVAETRAERKARILAPTTDFNQAEKFETLQGGSGTNTTRFDRNAFSLPSGALSFEQRSEFFIGNGVFDRPWVAAPSSTVSSDGLGPLYNARSCQGCHIKDGRGHPPAPGDTNMVSMLFALSDPTGAPDPVFGHQFQDQAIPGFQSEGQLSVSYANVPFTYPDGTKVSLRKPTYATNAALGSGVALNPRIAPPMIGLGLIEAVAAEDLLVQADPDDADGDGISGRAHRIDDQIGRFGWKATTATIRDQSAIAFHNDMG